MIEARIFVENLDRAKTILLKENARAMGDYEIHDTIFENVDASLSLADDFLRLRVMPKNIWTEKPVILAIKRTSPRQIGKESQVPLKLEFDHESQAQAYYKQHLRQTYKKVFAFSRTGRQHILPNGDVVDLELINGAHPSIEFKSPTDAGIKKLLQLFGVAQVSVITGPLVTEMKKRLTQQNAP